jgi:hypothetical protein
VDISQSEFDRKENKSASSPDQAVCTIIEERASALRVILINDGLSG